MKIGRPQNIVLVEPVENPIPPEIAPVDPVARSGDGQVDELAKPEEATASSA
jgi:hypothetical protein